ncbi:hypothetical protein ACHWQZ_G018545 [Mnemiopsis leidyi]
MNENETLPLYDRSLRIASMSLFCLGAIFGNLLFIVSYIQLRWLRTARHAYIINLAIADVLMGSFSMPVTIGSLIRDKWLFTFDGELNVFSCKLAAFLDNTVIGCSVWFLALSSFDRFVYICRPLRYATIMTTIRVRCSATSVWACALFLSSMPLMFWGELKYSEFSYNCGLNFGTGVHRYYFLFYAVTVILIPVTFTVFNFTGILIDLNSSSLGDGRKMLDSNRGAILTLLVLTLAFVVCSLPLFVTAIIIWFDPTKADNLPPGISIAFHWMLYMNSAVNPLLYGLFNPKLRSHYTSILTCRDKNKVSWVGTVCRGQEQSFLGRYSLSGTRTKFPG